MWLPALFSALWKDWSSACVWAIFECQEGRGKQLKRKHHYKMGSLRPLNFVFKCFCLPFAKLQERLTQKWTFCHNWLVLKLLLSKSSRENCTIKLLVSKDVNTHTPTEFYDTLKCFFCVDRLKVPCHYEPSFGVLCVTVKHQNRGL